MTARPKALPIAPKTQLVYIRGKEGGRQNWVSLHPKSCLGPAWLYDAVKTDARSEFLSLEILGIKAFVLIVSKLIVKRYSVVENVVCFGGNEVFGEIIDLIYSFKREKVETRWSRELNELFKAGSPIFLRAN